jgi:hypothetical protein
VLTAHWSRMGLTYFLATTGPGPPDTVRLATPEEPSRGPASLRTQQGVTSVQALIRQRARWCRGHMQAIRWLPRLCPRCLLAGCGRADRAGQAGITAV